MNRIAVRISIAKTTVAARRSPSIHAIAPHGRSQAAYCSEISGEQIKSAATAATDAAPKAPLRLRAHLVQTRTSSVTSATIDAADAHAGTDPIRGAPASSLIGPPVTIQ